MRALSLRRFWSLWIGISATSATLLPSSHAQNLNQMYGSDWRCGRITITRLVGESEQSYRDRQALIQSCYPCEQRGMDFYQDSPRSGHCVSRNTASVQSPTISSSDAGRYSNAIGALQIGIAGAQLYEAITRGSRATERRTTEEGQRQQDLPSGIARDAYESARAQYQQALREEQARANREEEQLQAAQEAQRRREAAQREMQAADEIRQAREAREREAQQRQQLALAMPTVVARRVQTPYDEPSDSEERQRAADSALDKEVVRVLVTGAQNIWAVLRGKADRWSNVKRNLKEGARLPDHVMTDVVQPLIRDPFDDD